MIKDIDFPTVEGVRIAIARRPNETNELEWGVYIINDNDFQLDNVLISSKGYGEKEGEKQRTSILRHMFERINGHTSKLVELIDPAVFHLYNEYLVSYYAEGRLFDKKFIFVPDSITEENMQHINKLELEGVLHS